MNLIDGKALADEVLKSAKLKIETHNLKPRLDIIWIGNNSASEVYINKKKAAGEMVGVQVVIHHYDEISEAELVTITKELNVNPEVSGIIIQLPVPEIDTHNAFAAISLEKDVDGLNPLSLGKLWQKQQVLIPATVRAIWLVLERTGADLVGKHALIINRSEIIGKPLAALLLAADCTVTIAHSKTKDLEKLTSTADIIVTGTGESNFISVENIKQDAIIVDVGFNKNAAKVSGDVNVESVAEKASWLSPVPNGVGPIGVAALIDNTVEAAGLQSAL